MSSLHNRVSRKQLKEIVQSDNIPRNTFSFYCYFPILDPLLFRNTWYHYLKKIGVMGRIYIANEGINAQINCPVDNLEKLKSFIYAEPALHNLRLNKAVDENKNSFYVLDIKVRKKIVSYGIEDSSFSVHNKGRYVNAAEFNKMLENPSTLVIDMRNHYEYEVGRFKTAVEIPSDTFREQLPMAEKMFKGDKDRDIIMYCTGGIRCEKASAWMLHKGYKNVFHLEGGIINYVNQVKENNLENHFIGKNFVFDERLGERITDDIIASCHICGSPCDTHVNCANSNCHLLFIQCDSCNKEYDGCCGDKCKSVIELNPIHRMLLKKSIDKERIFFNKSRKRMQDLKNRKK